LLVGPAYHLRLCFKHFEAGHSHGFWPDENSTVDANPSLVTAARNGRK
jgi:hypothetical protein